MNCTIQVPACFFAMSRCFFFCAFFLSLFLALNWRLQEQMIIMSGKRGRYTKKQTPKRNWIVALLCFLKYVVDRWCILFHVHRYNDGFCAKVHVERYR